MGGSIFPKSDVLTFSRLSDTLPLINGDDGEETAQRRTEKGVFWWKRSAQDSGCTTPEPSGEISRDGSAHYSGHERAVRRSRVEPWDIRSAKPLCADDMRFMSHP